MMKRNLTLTLGLAACSLVASIIAVGTHTHDAEAQLCKIRVPTQITFGRHDTVTSTRFAEPLKNGIENSELHIFEDCSHAPLYENVAAFNEKTLAFLRSHAS